MDLDGSWMELITVVRQGRWQVDNDRCGSEWERKVMIHETAD
jgi:hypothetical protein